MIYTGSYEKQGNLKVMPTTIKNEREKSVAFYFLDTKCLLLGFVDTVAIDKIIAPHTYANI